MSTFLTGIAPRLIAVVLVFYAGWTVQGWRKQTLIDGLELAQARQLEAMHAQALADYQRMEVVKDGAIKQAKKRAAQNAAAAAAATRTADGLRSDLASMSARIQSATSTTAAEYATTSAELLGECAAAVTDMAAAADGHATDALMMLEAWPR